MHAVRNLDLWRGLRSPGLAALLVTLGFCLLRARDLPSVDLGIGGTQVSITPQDLLLVAITPPGVVALARTRLDWWTKIAVVAGAAFGAWILVTGAANGAAAFVSAGKLVELAALGLAAIAFVRRHGDVEAVVDVLLAFTIAADIVGVVEFITGGGGGRQASFLGEHDFAAVASLPLVYGLALLFAEPRRVPRAAVAIAAGAVGCILGAALASVLGLYLGAATVVAVAWTRRELTLRRLGALAAVVAVVTGGTFTLRAGDLGFVQQWFGKPPSRPGQYAAGWSQRLIYAYVGGRVFLDHPLLGTGWWGELPPKEFARYLPDARRRFRDQPPRYFPSAHRRFIPQQTFDQVLYELGIVGATLLAALFVGLIGASARAARRARGIAAYLGAAWIAATIGALAGEPFFGGAALATIFWLVAGMAVTLSLHEREYV